ncbi:50S ribosomal protein L18 [Candidatus Uhrbacteria bacterium CG_4_9_14_3_um_filter_41_35]|uniref:Large ribosomal subunit protein uL18 n=1 Tax=Candidatus Uhrbacteria bacterium CG_4_9_14_3_um_filter_41_35 TaxID=1975034 RepID=A0A2M7XG26_9BACT|nr:MAG: 50S ribosomal protein L18 [Candidatus Uhrbacteria bacterium CG_4_9_14_3_um_filter_41_35]
MTTSIKQKHESKFRRANRTRARVQGTSLRPRLSVFRTAKHISVQAIDDVAGKTLVSSSDLKVDTKGKKPVEIAGLVGAEIAKLAIAAGIKTVVFDRGSYQYHGRVKSLAEGAREGGLEF